MTSRSVLNGVTRLAVKSRSLTKFLAADLGAFEAARMPEGPLGAPARAAGRGRPIGAVPWAPEADSPDEFT